MQHPRPRLPHSRSNTNRISIRCPTSIALTRSSLRNTHKRTTREYPQAATPRSNVAASERGMWKRNCKKQPSQVLRSMRLSSRSLSPKDMNTRPR